VRSSRTDNWPRPPCLAQAADSPEAAQAHAERENTGTAENVKFNVNSEYNLSKINVKEPELHCVEAALTLMFNMY
jgi:hypothetical protein